MKMNERMHKKTILILFYLANIVTGCSSPEDSSDSVGTIYPEFIEEQAITILGYNSHAMEPFITKDGNYLFFNSLNDGINTSLYYAQKQDYKTFTFMGEISGVNGVAPHLDAVASLDMHNDFYFVSTRNYPAVIENLQTGQFDDGTVSDVTPVYGDFNIPITGWLIMDAEVCKDGNYLYYVNAKFSGQPLPDESKIGIAVKQNTLFEKQNKSDEILQNINNATHLVYAPSISSDGKEIYFTRIKKGSFLTEICVSVRKNTLESFSVPKVLKILGDTPEAVSVTDDKSRIYYHKKYNGIYQIFTMKRK
jgi:hypothetical protein